MVTRRQRGLRVDPEQLKSRFADRISDGRVGTITWTRFLKFVRGRSVARFGHDRHVSEGVLKKLYYGTGGVQEDSLERLFVLTGIDLRRDAGCDGVGACLDRIRGRVPRLAGRIFQDGARTAALAGEVDAMVADLSYVHSARSDLGPSDLVALAGYAAQVAGSVQMLRAGPCERTLRDVLEIGVSLAGRIAVREEAAASTALGWLYYNWVWPGWRSWCRPQALLSEASRLAADHHFALSEAYFRRGAGYRYSAEEQTLRLSRLRTLMCADRDTAREVERLTDEVAAGLGPGDHASRGYLLALRSHWAFKRGDRRGAVGLLRDARSEYVLRFGSTSHRLVGECELRLAQLGDVPAGVDILESLRRVRLSGVPNSAIVDLGVVEDCAAGRGRLMDFTCRLRRSPMSVGGTDRAGAATGN